MATKTRPWRSADLERLPDDGNRYEVLDGVLLVTPQPSFRHNRVASMLVVQLHQHCREHRIGVVVGPGAVPRGHSELQPDVMVVPGPEPATDVRWKDLPTPALVIEVLSTSTSRRDLGIKRDAYLRWGVPEYWIVDTHARCVTVVRRGRDDEQVTGTLHWRPLPDLPALEIPLTSVFE